MSYREINMIEITEVLRRWQAGQSCRSIAQETGLDRKTVGRYLAAARSAELTADTILTEETVHKVATSVQQRDTLPPSAAWKALEAVRPRIEDWLKGPEPLRLTRVQELLVRDGVMVSYTTLRRFAHKELGWKERRATVRVDDAPAGEEAQIDFGLMGYVTDEEGKKHKLWVLVVLLAYSRYMFVWPTFTQTVVDVCAGLDAAWKFFGGVAHRVVFDNPSTMVLKADPKSPVLNRAFAEYAQSRGFLPDPARVRHPQDKARVENQVAHVRERWFAGESHGADLAVLQADAAHWCSEVAGTRVHGSTRRVPREVFETEERSKLLPAPESSFDVPRWKQAKIHLDHHAQVERALYSLPSRFIGKVLDVRVDSKLVRFYDSGECVRQYPKARPGQRVTTNSDYDAAQGDFAFRRLDKLLNNARVKGTSIGEYAERLLGRNFPFTGARAVYGLLRLCDKYRADRVEAVCARSLAFDVVDVRRVEKMLKSAHREEEASAATGKLVPLPSRFARDPATFATVSATQAKDGES